MCNRMLFPQSFGEDCYIRCPILKSSVIKTKSNVFTDFDYNSGSIIHLNALKKQSHFPAGM